MAGSKSKPRQVAPKKKKAAPKKKGKMRKGY